MNNESQTLIRLNEVMRRVGLSKVGIYEAMAAGTFPQQVRISERRVAWVEGEIDAWVKARISERNR